jgi:hypothetical protein
MTGNESNPFVISTISSQVLESQDMPVTPITPNLVESETANPPDSKTLSTPVGVESITVQEYSAHMSLTSAQLETVALMLQVLEQTNSKESNFE